jgi:V8-like Glu-specific endopeptidase
VRLRVGGFVLGLTVLQPLLVAGQSVDERKGVTDEAAKRAKAAEAFARMLAPEGTEAYAVAFRKALEAADAAMAASTSSLRAARGMAPGGIEADPRYIRNLKAMSHESKDKIFGGQRVPPGAFPDAVAILGAGGLCTGTVIAPRTVVTAAHCHFAGVNKKVVIGDDVSRPQKTIDVTKSVPWKPDRWKEGDLALLFLKEDTGEAPRRMAKGEWINAASDVRVVGYGRTENPDAEPSGIKRLVDVPVASTSCSGTVGPPTGMSEDSTYYGCNAGRELVAGLPLLDRDSCNGDSGGPVYVRGPDNNYYLAAATSRAVSRPGLRPCGDGGIYVRTDGAALEWITSQDVAVTLGPYARSTPNPRTPPRLSAAGAIRLASLAPSSALAAYAGLRLSQTGTEAASTASARAELQKVARAESATGRFEKRAGTLVFALANNPDQTLPIANPNDVPAALIGLPVHVDFQATAAGIEARAIVPEPAAVWNRQNAALPEEVKDPIQRAVSDLEQAVEGANAQPPGEGLRSVSERSRQLYEQIVQQYMTVPPEAVELRRRLIETFKGARRFSKAVYGRADIYPPQTYEQIFKESQVSVGLTRNGESQPFCSGALVAKDKVLTAGHCLFLGADDLEVWLGYDNGVPAAAVDRYPVKDVVRKGSRAYDPDGAEMDFAILKVEPNSQQKLPGDRVSAKCLSTKRVRRGDPLYVVGHPLGQPRAVHDNAFVQFPFRVTQLERSELELIVQSEQAQGEPLHLMEEFQRSYRCCASAANVQLYENYSFRWGRQPTIGADADTYHGDSGSPVFNRRNHKLVGILFAGADDIQVARTVGWQSHEAILPASCIVSSLEAQLGPDWAVQQGMCVDP